MPLPLLSLVYNYLGDTMMLQQICGPGPVPPDDGGTIAIDDAVMILNLLVSPYRLDVAISHGPM